MSPMYPIIRRRVPPISIYGVTAMSNMDFSMAKMKHQTWKLRVRGFLDGRENINTSELSSHKECALGKWLYSEGLSKYATLPNFKALEREHMKMHGVVKQIVQLKQSGNSEKAESEYHNMAQLSDKVVALLSALEKEFSS